MHIAVIASMKRGLEHFIYRELSLYSAQGLSISLFPTRHSKGLYNPRKEWHVCLWRPLAVACLQPYFFLRYPIQYLRLLAVAIRFGACIDVALAWYFARKMSDVDVIYATFGDHKFFVGYFCKQILGKPLVVTIHAYELYQNPNLTLFLRALSAADQIVAVTEYNQEYLASHYNVDPKSVQVVRLSIDTEEYAPARKFVILIVGFFVERKGHEILFEAVRKLGRPDIEVWVVGGEGPERPVDVRGMAAQLGIEPQVVFFGKLSGNALRALYRSCDVFCLPCRFDSHGVAEGFPSVLVEAMAIGKPVISTRHVEIPRIIENIIVEENDVDGLATAIARLYESPSLRQQLGEWNRQRAVQVFSPTNSAKMIDIFHQISNGRALHSRPDVLPSEFDVA